MRLHPDLTPPRGRKHERGDKWDLPPPHVPWEKGLIRFWGVRGGGQKKAKGTKGGKKGDLPGPYGRFAPLSGSHLPVRTSFGRYARPLYPHVSKRVFFRQKDTGTYMNGSLLRMDGH